MHNGILSNCPVQWGLHPSYAALLDAISCSRQGNKLLLSSALLHLIREGRQC